MYIIEKLVRLYIKYTSKDIEINVPSAEDKQEKEDVLTCKHTFMPIDSTGEILACSKCGYLINKSRIRNKKKKKS